MQKVICPYCGRVAKYVDSSVIYYGHSYGMRTLAFWTRVQPVRFLTMLTARGR